MLPRHEKIPHIRYRTTAASTDAYRPFSVDRNRTTASTDAYSSLSVGKRLRADSYGSGRRIARDGLRSQSTV